MILITGVLEGYLKAGSEFRHTDVAGMLEWLPVGTLFKEGDTTWEVFQCGECGALEGNDGRVLFADWNGGPALMTCDEIAGKMRFDRFLK